MTWVWSSKSFTEVEYLICEYTSFDCRTWSSRSNEIEWDGIINHYYSMGHIFLHQILLCFVEFVDNLLLASIFVIHGFIVYLDPNICHAHVFIWGSISIQSLTANAEAPLKQSPNWSPTKSPKLHPPYSYTTRYPWSWTCSYWYQPYPY